jgi:hypothetical protein
MLLEHPELLLLLAYYLHEFFESVFEIADFKIITNIDTNIFVYLFVEHVSVNIWLQLGRLTDA